MHKGVRKHEKGWKLRDQRVFLNTAIPSQWLCLSLTVFFENRSSAVHENRTSGNCLCAYLKPRWYLTGWHSISAIDAKNKYYLEAAQNHFVHCVETRPISIPFTVFSTIPTDSFVNITTVQLFVAIFRNNFSEFRKEFAVVESLRVGNNGAKKVYLETGWGFLQWSTL